MEDPQDGPRGEIIEKHMVLQHFCSEVCVSLETSSKKCLRKGCQKLHIMNDDADDDDDDDDDDSDGDDDDRDGDGDGDDDDGVVVLVMVAMMRTTMMVRATGRRISTNRIRIYVSLDLWPFIRSRSVFCLRCSSRGNRSY